MRSIHTFFESGTGLRFSRIDAKHYGTSLFCLICLGRAATAERLVGNKGQHRQFHSRTGQRLTG
jgi:hypothetical protein